MTHEPESIRSAHAAPQRGFTLTEMLVTLTVLSAVLVVLGTVMLSAQRSKSSTSNQIEAVQSARAATDLIARDLRAAGFGADLDYATDPQPAIAYIDSTQVLINVNLQPYPDTTQAGPGGPQAYNPTGNPRPRPLDGTAWQPPIKYRTGAEVVRWTLDLNNDGMLDDSDLSTTEGLAAQRTRNPNDVMLVRQVYGDSTGNVTGNNGGAKEAISLVRKPDGTVPPIFTVYMRGQTTPYNWGLGPIPAAKLNEIERIVLKLTTTSARPDWKGNYAETTLETEVNFLRNTPSFAFDEFAISGYVWDDKDKDKVKDGGEPGIEGAQLLLSGYLTLLTDANGYYQFKVPQGTYVLKQIPPTGYGVYTSPDSFIVTVGPSTSRSFADTARAGGWVTAKVFLDVDKDNNWDGGELAKEGVEVWVNGDSLNYSTTDDLGEVSLFVPVGTYTCTIATPDSFVASGPTTVTGTMTNGGTKEHKFGVYLSNFGTVTGTVFVDNNRNNLFDVKEPGVQNVWVGVAREDGTTLGYAYTNDKGFYSIKVPVNDPPHTSPYTIQCIPPTGYSALSVLTKENIWVQDAVTIANQNFGLGTFYVIVAEAKRVLSVASGDLMENDWGFTLGTTPRKDKDIVLGAEASGVDNVMVWFNRYDDKPLFDSRPTYTRDAPGSVLAIAIDSLDASPPRKRLDVVTGTRYAAAGNFFVWLTQNTSGNEGVLASIYRQSCKTLDNGDVQVVKTRQLAGGPSPDIVVGTRSPTPGQGTFEVWANADTAIGSFIRVGQYPPLGGIPGNALGEVAAMEFSDFDKDGNLDLAVGTRTGPYAGQLMFFEMSLGQFVFRNGYTISNGAVTSMCVLDMDSDGKMDLVLGTESGLTTGTLQYWRNEDSPGSPMKFSLQRERAAPGIVTALAAGDFGGVNRDDIVMGWRHSNNDYAGGVQIWYTDSKDLDVAGVDPSGGDVKNMVTGITINNFDFGVYPIEPSPPYLLDFAVGVKENATAGSLVIFIR